MRTVYAENPNAYNAVAWTIVENEGWDSDSVKFAKKLAYEACELSEWSSAPIMDTLAWAKFRSGDAEGAVKIQKKAIKLLGEDHPQLDSYKQSLATFEG